jgi:putative flippase GtrA
VTATTTLSSDPLDTSPSRRLDIASIRSLIKSEKGKQAIKFAAVSAIAIAISQVTLAVTYGAFKLSGTSAQLAAFVASALPSYYLNRAWVWGKSGKSDFKKEIAPFWGINIAQLLLSLVYIKWAQRLVEEATTSHPLRTAGLLFNSLFIYGVMWIAKFFVFNKMFKHDNAVESPAL